MTMLLLVVRSLSHVQLFAIPWTAARQAALSFPISRGLPKFMSIQSLMPFIHLILCHPLLLPPSVFHSIGVFSNESVLPIRWLDYWSFSFSISPFKNYSGLISFRIDCFDLVAISCQSTSLRRGRCWGHRWLRQLGYPQSGMCTPK